MCDKIIKQDCFHHFALDSNRQTINIESIKIENRHNGYSCVSCGGEMIPVLGKIREHHFRHKTDACSYESYIHKLWKKYIFEQWHNMAHLYVTYNVEYCCDKTKTCKLFAANKTLRCSGIFEQETIDLKEKYDTCEIEGVYGGFRADLLLSNSHTPHTVPTFIEICYKHPCNEQKRHAGIPIIEIKVSDDNLHLPETLIEKSTLFTGLGTRPVGNCDIALYGFDRKKQVSHNVRRFYAYQDENGINHGKVDRTILSCNSLDEHIPDSMMEIFVADTNTMNDSSLFEFGVKMASKCGIKIKHCFFCRYYGNRGKTCQLSLPIEKDSWLININDLSDTEFDKTNYTFLCPRYYEKPIKNGISIEETPHIVWNNNEYKKKPVNTPTDVNIKANLTIQRLKMLDLQHKKVK